jgi:hypothetical protein
MPAMADLARQTEALPETAILAALVRTMQELKTLEEVAEEMVQAEEMDHMSQALRRKAEMAEMEHHHRSLGRQSFMGGEAAVVPSHFKVPQLEDLEDLVVAEPVAEQALEIAMVVAEQIIREEEVVVRDKMELLVLAVPV